MTAEHAYGEALQNMPGSCRVGMKTAVTAINDGDYKMAASCLRTVAGELEKEE